MLFNSIEYLFFFPTVVGLYFATAHRYRWILLLTASYFFYMAWKPVYIILIVISTLIDYLCSYQMGRYVEDARRKTYLYISLLANLSLLFTFKYYTFFSDTLSDALRVVAWHNPLPAFAWLLPVGISFYTFQTMSYSIDVYHRRIPPEKHLGVFALFVSYFPQLVAGPIERAENLLGQLKMSHSFSYPLAISGLKLIAWGLFKKVVIADNAAVLVNQVYNHPTQYEGVSLLLATVLFAFQIYGDFSGYSDIAIGSARVMGVHLMKNFDRPYFSRSIAEFWRRWHISLSTWFRDYLYIPLGGSRVVKWRWYYNLFITFLISGIWHGANWTFVIWGALHGFYLVFGLLTASYRTYWSQWLGLYHYPLLHRLLQVGTTFGLVCFSWIFFRANTLADALYMVQHLFTGVGQAGQWTTEQVRHVWLLDQNIRVWSSALLGIGFLLAVHRIERKGEFFQLLAYKPLWVKWSFYYLLVLSILFYGNFGQEQFIYFQF